MTPYNHRYIQMSDKMPCPCTEFGCLDNIKFFNVALLGVLSEHIDLPEKAWRQAIEQVVPKGSFDGNWKAFQTGKKYA